MASSAHPDDDRAEGVPPREAIRHPLPNRFRPETYIPAPITLVNGYLVWGGSRIYRERFGIGINEWRVLGALSNSPGATAATTGRTVGMNKAILSRSIAVLLEKGLIVREADRRPHRLYLTQAGVEMFDKIMPVAAERERVLLGGLDDDEIATLRRLLTHLVNRGEALREFDAGMLSGDDVDMSTSE